MKSPNLASLVDFQKMVFIYNAVNDGWTVKLLSDGRYEFRRKNVRVTSDEDECLDSYLNKFIQFCKGTHRPLLIPSCPPGGS